MNFCNPQASWDETVPVRKELKVPEQPGVLHQRLYAGAAGEAAEPTTEQIQEVLAESRAQKMPASQVSQYSAHLFSFGFLVDFRRLNHTYVKRKCLFSIYEGYSIQTQHGKDECLNSERSTETKRSTSQ